ncbi:sodium/solute symporter [Salinisphaera sp. Q1T1-3]|uniref:sodium:solute symporter family transporter n=1 Tax=Salinisphaera sp. Q1T1-3 TaxID=2321229 RepID=UPI000E7514A3|nr:sodium/solute symporter [Salinisphaera sp. Q1T1-3]RJS93587.1 sodium transporter [Salinisphaera sp. Q1T1-3]
MSWIDYAVIFVYLGGFLWLGHRLQSNASGTQYFLGDRGFGWFVLALSAAATQLSSASFISAPAFTGMREGGGLVWLAYEFAVPLAMAFLIVCFFPTLYAAGVVSIYGFLEQRFGPSTQRLLSVVFQLSRAFATSVMLYAVALILTHALDMPLWLTVLVIGLVTLIYCYLGGMKAVVYGDAIQMGLLVIGLVACLGVGLARLGGWQAFVDHVDPARLVAVNFSDWGLGDEAGFGFWPMLVGGLFLYVSYYGADQSQAQRLLSARDATTVRRTLLANGLLRFPVTLCYCVMGLVLGTLATQVPAFGTHVPANDPDLLVPVFIRQELPAGLTGLLIVAIFSAAMSSVSSAINSLSAASVEDLVFRGRQVDSATYMRASHLATLFWGAVCLGLAFLTGHIADTIIEAINKIGSVFFGPILATFVSAILWPRIDARGANAGLVSGVALNVALWLFVPALFWFWWNVTGAVACWLVAGLVSRPARSRARPISPRLDLHWPSIITLVAWFVCIVGISLALPTLLRLD